MTYKGLLRPYLLSMSSNGTGYYDGVTRYLSDEEQARGRAAIERLEAVWLPDPERAKDLERLRHVRFQLRLGYLPLRDLSWLRDRISEAT